MRVSLSSLAIIVAKINLLASGAVLKGTLQLSVTTSAFVERHVEVHFDVRGKTYALKYLLILGHGDHLGDIEIDRGPATFADNAGIVLIVYAGVRSE